MELNDFDALSFDCYGTLIDWESGISAVLQPWAERVGSEQNAEWLLTRYAGHEARVERENPGMRYSQVLATSFSELGRDIGKNVSDADARQLGSSVPDWPAFDDSAEALEELARRYLLIILSNVDRESFGGSQRRLGVNFDAVITAEDLGVYKPDPRAFDGLLQRTSDLGIPRDRLLHVAQSLFHDHLPAKTKRLSTVWINRRHDRPGWGATPAPSSMPTPDWEFTSMAAFVAAVGR